MIERLARSQARGERQMQYVSELLSRKPVHYTYKEVPGKVVKRYGYAELSTTSYVNLRKRLREVGFAFKTDTERMTVEMFFPEEGW